MMKQSDSIIGAVGRLRSLPYHSEFAALPEATRNHVLAAIGEPSPVVSAVDGFEALWAVRGLLGEAAREVAADLAFQVMAGGFHGKGARADAALRWLRADAGEIPAEGLPEAPTADERFAVQSAPADPEPEPEDEPA